MEPVTGPARHAVSVRVKSGGVEPVFGDVFRARVRDHNHLWRWLQRHRPRWACIRSDHERCAMYEGKADSQGPTSRTILWYRNVQSLAAAILQRHILQDYPGHRLFFFTRPADQEYRR